MDSVRSMYEKLVEYYGNTKWFSTEDDFEIIVGVVLMQGSLLRDVARAINTMKAEDLLDPRKLFFAPENIIERSVKATRFYKSKVKKLKNFVTYLKNYDFSVRKMKKKMGAFDVDRIKEELMKMKGIGSETADMLLLQLFNIPLIPPDKGLTRILERIFRLDFENIKIIMTENGKNNTFLPHLILSLLEHSRIICKKKPKCPSCVLKDICKSAPGGI